VGECGGPEERHRRRGQGELEAQVFATLQQALGRRSFEWCAASDEAGLAALRMRRVLDGEADREAVLARFVTALPPDGERLLRELLSPAEDGPRL
jgi:hypothetical protein